MNRRSISAMKLFRRPFSSARNVPRAAFLEALRCWQWQVFGNFPHCISNDDVWKHFNVQTSGGSTSAWDFLKSLPHTSRPKFGEDLKVVIAGLCNGYSSYVATFEEYQIQRYEGASTIYGPHTLDAYLQEFGKLASAMVEGKPVDGGPTPPDLMSKQISLLPPVVIDATPFGASFGGVVDGCDAKPEYTIGDKVKVSFHAACPRNDVRLEGTFMTVQKRDAAGGWSTVLTDDAWETAFRWSRPFPLSPFSLATMEWTITPQTEPGEYRIQYLGDAKEFFGARPKPFQGASQPFLVKRAGFTGRLSLGSVIPWLPKQWSPLRANGHDLALQRMVVKIRETYAADYASS